MEPAIFRIHDAEDASDSRARAHSESGIRSPESGIRSPESGIRSPEWIRSQPPRPNGRLGWGRRHGGPAESLVSFGTWAVDRSRPHVAWASGCQDRICSTVYAMGRWSTRMAGRSSAIMSSCQATGRSIAWISAAPAPVPLMTRWATAPRDGPRREKRSNLFRDPIVAALTVGWRPPRSGDPAGPMCRPMIGIREAAAGPIRRRRRGLSCCRPYLFVPSLRSLDSHPTSRSRSGRRPGEPASGAVAFVPVLSLI